MLQLLPPNMMLLLITKIKHQQFRQLRVYILDLIADEPEGSLRHMHEEVVLGVLLIDEEVHVAALQDAVEVHTLDALI